MLFSLFVAFLNMCSGLLINFNVKVLKHTPKFSPIFSVFSVTRWLLYAITPQNRLLFSIKQIFKIKKQARDLSKACFYENLKFYLS